MPPQSHDVAMALQQVVTKQVHTKDLLRTGVSKQCNSALCKVEERYNRDIYKIRDAHVRIAPAHSSSKGCGY